MEIRTVDSEGYAAALRSAIRPGGENVLAFYEHRVGVIGADPKLMLMLWDDHLVHRGDGVFETMKFVGRRLYQLKEHLRRMQNSSEAIFLKPPLSWNEVGEVVLAVCRATSAENGLVRVLLGRGAGGFGLDPFECPAASLYVVAYRFTPKPEAWYEKGVTAFKTSVPAKQPYLARIKTIDYLPNVLMKREAVEKGYHFPFCFDQHGLLAEGATENVCIVDQDGRLVIPEFTNALAGTTLMRAVDLVKGEVEVIFRSIREDEILDAREVIVCGTSIDAVPVVRFGGKPIHNVKPGPVATLMRRRLLEDIEKNGLAL